MSAHKKSDDQELLLAAQQEVHNASNACAFGAFIQGKHPRFHHNRLLEQATGKKAEAPDHRTQGGINGGAREGQFIGGPRWLYVYNHHDENLHAVELVLDSGSAGNFVARAFVEKYGLDVETCQSTVFKTIDGHTFACQRQALICWTIDSIEGVRSTRFYVLPDGADIEGPLVGERFLQEFYWELLCSDPSQANATLARNPMTPEQHELKERTKADLAAKDEQRGQRARAHCQTPASGPGQGPAPAPAHSQASPRVDISAAASSGAQRKKNSCCILM